jgi:hypothetical protein
MYNFILWYQDETIIGNVYKNIQSFDYKNSEYANIRLTGIRELVWLLLYEWFFLTSTVTSTL